MTRQNAMHTLKKICSLLSREVERKFPQYLIFSALCAMLSSCDKDSQQFFLGRRPALGWREEEILAKNVSHCVCDEFLSICRVREVVVLPQESAPSASIRLSRKIHTMLCVKFVWHVPSIASRIIKMAQIVNI